MSACNKFLKDSSKHPVTNRTLKSGSSVYKNIEKFCTNEQENCRKLQQNSAVNPITNKKGNTQLYKSLCAVSSSSACSIDNINNDPFACIVYPEITLKNHQKEVCKYVLKNDGQKGLMIFHSVGSGKTITALTLSRCLDKNDRKVFIITPKSILNNFNIDLKKLKIKPANIVLTTHVKFTNKVKKEGTDFVKNNILIIDEAHKFISYKSKGTKRMMQATSAAHKVFLLSASPIQNKPVEFATLFSMVSNNEKNIKEILTIFSGRKDKFDEMNEILYNYISYFKNTSTDDYPSVSYQEHMFFMTEKYYEAYIQIEDGLIMQYLNNNEDANRAAFYNGIRRGINFIDNDPSVRNLKIDWIMKKLTTSNRKTLIYSNWLASGLDRLQEEMTKKNIEFGTIKGSLSIKQRSDIIRRFNNDEYNVMLISTAGAEGLDLKGVRDVIILEPHWNNERIKQVIGRAVRFKSHAHLPEKERTVTVHTLLLNKPARVIKIENTPGYNPRVAPPPSADILLNNLSKDKDELIEKFYKVLQKNAIGRNK